MFSLLGLLILLDSLFLIIIKNPVHSIYVLILIVLKLAIYLILLKCEFLGLLLMLIYLGAIIVLFIFIIMMLNIKLLILSPMLNNYLIISFISYIYIYPMLDFFFKIKEKPILFGKEDLLYLYCIDDVNTIIALGLSLYNLYFIIVIFIGLLLFSSMLGALFLTLDKINKDIKKQNILFQVYKEYKIKKYKNKKN